MHHKSPPGEIGRSWRSSAVTLSLSKVFLTWKFLSNSSSAAGLRSFSELGEGLRVFRALFSPKWEFYPLEEQRHDIKQTQQTQMLLRPREKDI